MKRADNNEESNVGTKRRKLALNFDGGIQKTDVKYSEKMDLKTTFGLKLDRHQIVSNDGSKLLFLVITKNCKIGKQLDKILNCLNNNVEQLLMVGHGDGIQKMVTIIEILKQKMRQTQPDAKPDVTNDMIARTENFDLIKLKGQLHDEKYEYNYNQLNFLDFTSKEKDIVPKDIAVEGLYNRDIINEELKVKKTLKTPVLYIYMTFHSEEKESESTVKKINNLVASGWSLQRC